MRTKIANLIMIISLISLTSCSGVFPVHAGDTKEKRFDETDSSKDIINFNDYTISKVMEKEGKKGKVIIKKNDKVVMNFSKCENGEFSNLIDIKGVTSSIGKELVVFQQAEGTHGSEYLWVIKLDNEPKIIFDSEKWDLDTYFLYSDLDGDGKNEIIASTRKYDYRITRHDFVAYPLFIFGFDEKLGTYVPANEKYFEYTYKMYNEMKKDEKKIQNNDDESLKWAKLRDAIVSLYMYSLAGRMEKAGESFKEEYKYEDQEKLLIMFARDIKSNPVYIYTNQQLK